MLRLQLACKVCLSVYTTMFAAHSGVVFDAVCISSWHQHCCSMQTFRTLVDQCSHPCSFRSEQGTMTIALVKAERLPKAQCFELACMALRWALMMPVCSLPESKGGMATAVVEFDSLANAVGAPSQDEHLALVCWLRLTLPIVGAVHVGRGCLKLCCTGVHPLEGGQDAQLIPLRTHLKLLCACTQPDPLQVRRADIPGNLRWVPPPPPLFATFGAGCQAYS